MRKYDYSKPVVLNQYEAGYPLEIPRRYDVDIELTSLQDVFDWQITYKFTDEIRGNQFSGGVYGAPAMTFRRLYVILCERFNDGNYFIEDYFDYIYGARGGVKDEADSFLEDVNNEIMEEYAEIMSHARITKAGNLDKRFTRTAKKLSEFKVMADARVKIAGDLLAERVKLDIRQCLMTGIIPLSLAALAESTNKQRVKAGLPADIVFFASGQLIDNLHIYFRLEKK